jgi:hypothetical protein
MFKLFPAIHCCLYFENPVVSYRNLPKKAAPDGAVNGIPRSPDFEANTLRNIKFESKVPPAINPKES